MNPFKQLAGQTAIYGMSSILGRLLNYLLVPVYTRVLAPGEYGDFSVMFSYVGILIVIVTYGMETAYFRYAAKYGNNSNVYSSTFWSVFVTSALFIVLTQCFASPLALLIDYADHPEYVRWFGWVIGIDALTSIPFAYLRQMGKAKKFAIVRLVNIAIFVLCNLFFIVLSPYIMNKGGDSLLKPLIGAFFNEKKLVSYVFISNVISSASMLLLLFPEILKGFGKFDVMIWKKLMTFAIPMLFVGLSGNINENIDRLMLRYMLPAGIAEAQVGIYSACYKISILMALFTQAYRYAAEPFFFNYAKEKDSKTVYATLLNYFVIIVCALFLLTMLFLDVIIIIIGQEYREGQTVIPILMMALLFLGVYYNLSIWYKLSDKTIYGAIISFIGAAITIIVNLITIPFFGFIGSAWATLACYTSMMVISYFWGQKHFAVNYNIKKFCIYTGSALLIYFASSLFGQLNLYIRLAINVFLFFLFVLIACRVEKISPMAVLRKMLAREHR
ncbi:MAG: oligosaccharide flippase family protein [Bacteroidales bacterium]|nr:oligosaccharide flippase family protein [Bacteroidales bacterium]